MRIAKIVFFGIALLAGLSVQGQDKLLDFWDEETRLFGVAKLDQNIDYDILKRRDINYMSKSFSLDHSTKKVGDLSILYTPNKSGMSPKFGFVSNLWQDDGWNIKPSTCLKFWLKVEGANIPEKWKISIIDNNGLKAQGIILKTNTSNTWKEISIRLKSLKIPKGFNWSSVKMCEFDAKFNNDTKIWLDGIQFEQKGEIIGVTDKSITQRMDEAEKSKSIRVKDALLNASKSGEPSESPTLEYVVSAFAKMMLNEDLEKANEILVDELKKSSDENAWSLLHTPLYCRFYFNFSNTKGKYPGRMTAETEALLLKTLWDRTAAKNDIHWARQSTWYLDGSENHDMNAKACNLLTSRIFMNEPAYKNRIFPDYGFGGSYHYGHAGYYGKGINDKIRHGGGRASLSDGKKYNAKAHYDTWVDFFKTYFKSRVERGFFLEYGSRTYSKHTLNMIDLVYSYAGNEALKTNLDDFLTLYWAEWAQVSISGVRGGPKTRHHSNVEEGNGTPDLISFHLGGAGNAGVWWYWNIINDFKLPKIVWQMALDRQGMGSFTYKSRGIGEEDNTVKRPLGAERSLVVDTDARFLKNTYVTPEYTIGTQMDHPSAVHSHLSIIGRWHGMTFAQSPKSRIVPVGVTNGTDVKGKKSMYDLEVKYQTVQYEKTLIVQQNRRWFAQHPEWWPTVIEYNQPVGIWLGKHWDKQVEKEGWIFVQSGNGYAAVKPVLWDEVYEKENSTKTKGNQQFFNAPNDPPKVKIRTDAYTWSEDQSIIKLEDNHTPVIIEAASVSDYPTLEDFIADILDNPIALYKTVVPGYNILVYKGCGTNAKEIVFNSGTPEIPSIGGEPINYKYPMTFDSPFLKSKYKSGKVEIKYGGESLNLNFNNTKNN